MSDVKMPKARHAASSGWKKEILGSEALCGGIKKKTIVFEVPQIERKLLSSQLIMNMNS